MIIISSFYRSRKCNGRIPSSSSWPARTSGPTDASSEPEIRIRNVDRTWKRSQNRPPEQRGDLVYCVEQNKMRNYLQSWDAVCNSGSQPFVTRVPPNHLLCWNCINLCTPFDCSCTPKAMRTPGWESPV